MKMVSNDYKTTGVVTVTVTQYQGIDTEVIIPSEIEGEPVTNIGHSAFRNCTSLTNVTIPNTVTSIGDCAFRNCTSLTNVTIPDSIINIGYDAFMGCTSLTNINVDSNNANYSSIDGVLFNKNKTKLICYPIGKTSTSYTIPNSVTNIDGYAFEGCTGLTSVTIPDSVTSIGYTAFGGCTSLTSIEIPDSVTSIVDYAFWDCTSLTSVEIPDSVTSIGKGAFGYYYDTGYKKINGFTIKGTKDSGAERYANNNGFKFDEVN